MSAIDDILGQIPLDQLAQQLGADPGEVQEASTQVIKSLLGGMQANVQDPDGEQSLETALAQHANEAQALADGTLDLSQIDVNDGEAIVQHALGTDLNQAATLLGSRTGANQSLLSKLMPMLAPLVLGYLFNKRSQPAAPQQQSGGGLLDSIFGGGAGGGLFGGGQQQSADADLQQAYEQGYRKGFQDAQAQLQGRAASQQQFEQYDPRTQGQQQTSLGDLLGGMLGGSQPQRQQQTGFGGILDGLFGR